MVQTTLISFQVSFMSKHFTLNMAAVRASETLLSYNNFSWCLNPEDLVLKYQRRDSLKTSN
jgi:hypothetical protein